jgi:hypothetical protein
MTPELIGRLRSPVEETDAEETVMLLLQDTWNTAYSAGALAAATQVRAAILDRPGRLRRLREIWPLTPENIDEFRQLLFLGATR